MQEGTDQGRMHDRWVGLQAGVDAHGWARVLRRAHDVAISDGRTPSVVRDVIADSWARCSSTGVEADRPGAPLAFDPDDAAARWREHPLSRTSDVLSSVLGDLLFDARHIVVVSDADGTLMWSAGHPDVLRASEAIRFSPGHAWSESAAGTNAVGTALAADHAVQVFSAEHFRSEVHGWQCSGAPVHDPDCGEILGAIDVTGDYRTAHPHNLALVELAARLVEEQLRRETLERDQRTLGLFVQHAARYGGPAAALSPGGRVLATTPTQWITGHVDLPDDGDPAALDDGTELVTESLGEGVLLVPARGRSRATRPVGFAVRVLAPGHVVFCAPGGDRRLSTRHSEIVQQLIEHRDGLTARELSSALYSDGGHEISVRAELHRLRGIFGPRLATRPYRLVDVDLDAG